MSRARAIIYLITAAILWSTGGVLVKLVDWNAMAISGVRSGIAALFLMFIVRRLKFTFSRNQILGSLCYAGMVMSFVVGTKLTAAANIILLQYAAPVYVAILSGWVLKEPTDRRDWLMIGSVIFGLLLFFSDSLSFEGWAGNILGVFSGMCFAGVILFLRRQKDGSPVESVILGNILSFLLGVPFMFDGGPTLLGWGGVFLLGIFQLGVAYFLYTKAIKEVTGVEASIIPIFEPVLNPIWVLLMVQEVPSIRVVIGGLIILTAVTIRSLLALKAAPSLRRVS